MQILKGKITKTLQGGKYATVSTIGGMVYSKVLMIYPYGLNSNIEIDGTSLCLLFISGNNIFAIPFNTPLQTELLNQECEVGNLKNGNKITFKVDGENDVVGNTNFTNEIDATGKINTAASYEVDGVKVVGNQSAAIANPTGGIIIDIEARAALNDLLTKLRTHGIIAT